MSHRIPCAFCQLYTIDNIPPLECLVRMAGRSEENIHRAIDMWKAAVSEAGWPTTIVRRVRYVYTNTAVPDSVVVKARLLVCDALGIPHPELATEN